MTVFQRALACLFALALLAPAGTHAATYSYRATTYAWDTVSTVASWTAGSADDGWMVANIGFTFPFGGASYTQVRITTNGFVHFGPDQAGTTTYTNVALPKSVDRTIAAFWDDLDPGRGGTVTYGMLGSAPNRRFTISFNAVRHYSASRRYSFQTTLYEDGTFRLQYGTTGDSGLSATIGVEVSDTDYTEYSFNSAAATNGLALLFFAGPLAEYSMEQTSWSGGGSVLDASGNGFHGNPTGTVSTVIASPATPPGTCRAAVIPSNSTTAAINAIDTNLDVDNRMRRSGTISFWYRSNSTWDASGGDRQLLDATVTSGRPFSLVKRGNGTLRFSLTDSDDSVVTVTSPSYSTPAGTWVHVAVTFSYGSNARARIYVNGTLVATDGTSTADSIATSIGTLYVGDNRSSAAGGSGTGNSADGQIDEVRLYSNERTAAEINLDRAVTRPCASTGVNDYAISYPGGTTGLTCEPAQVTFTARDGTGAVVNPSAGTTLTVTTSTGTGTWVSPLVTGSGTWTPSGSNNGQATYAWSGGESSFTVRLRQTATGAMNLNVADSNGRVEGSAVDPTITFAGSAFRITANGTSAATIGTHIAGKPSNVGYGAQTLYLQAIRTDTSTGSCTTVFQNQTVNVELASQCNNPTTCTPAPGVQVLVQNSASTMTAIAQNNGSASPTSYTSVALTFDSQSKAPFIFSYGDVGQLTFHARYGLPSPPAGQYMSGSSPAFVVRPFGLRIGVTGPGTGMSGATGTPTVVAGSSFTGSVTAVAWKSGDDADADGQPDNHAQIAANAATPGFGRETAPASASLSYTVAEPSGGASGTLTGTSFAAFTNGIASQTMNWSEVGILNLFAATTNYLGSGQDATASSTGLPGVGRFIPARFTLTGGTLTNRTVAACSPASTFSYMNEGIGIAFTLNARNASGVTTTNYRGTFARLALDATGLGFAARDTTSGTNLTSRVDTAAWTAGTWVDGTASVTGTLAIRRALAPDNPDGPYTQVRIGIAPVDADGVALAAYDFDADGTAGNDHAQVGTTTQLRFGRLRVSNAIGSDRLALPVPMQVDYWSGSGFVVNTLDSCTTIARASVGLGNWQSNLGACETALSAATISFTGGVATPTLTAPGAGNAGSVDLRVYLGAAAGTHCPSVGGSATANTSASRSYLLGRWNSTDNDGNANTNHDDDPSARATFGIYGTDRASNRIIYMRENY